MLQLIEGHPGCRVNRLAEKYYDTRLVLAQRLGKFRLLYTYQGSEFTLLGFTTRSDRLIFTQEHG